MELTLSQQFVFGHVLFQHENILLQKETLRKKNYFSQIGVEEPDGLCRALATAPTSSFGSRAFTEKSIKVEYLQYYSLGFLPFFSH